MIIIVVKSLKLDGKTKQIQCIRCGDKNGHFGEYMERESQEKLCKTCGQIKTRFLYGKFNKKDKKWRDANGSLWNGHVCPDCHRDKCKERQRSKRKVESNGQI